MTAFQKFKNELSDATRDSMNAREAMYMNSDPNKQIELLNAYYDAANKVTELERRWNDFN